MLAEVLESAVDGLKPKGALPTPRNGVDHASFETHRSCVHAEDGQLRKKGPAARGTHHVCADLPQLHHTIGTYARTLVDLQHMRVITDNRIRANLEAKLPIERCELLKALSERLVEEEHGIELYLTRLVRTHPMWPFISAAPGIGPGTFAQLVSITGGLDRFATVSKLWKYLGLAVIDGHRARMPKGELASHTNCAGGTHLPWCKPGCETDHHPNCTPGGFGTAYSPRGLVVCHQLGESIEKLKVGNGPYRETYDRRKAMASVLHPEWTPMHLRADARRVAVKALIRDLWLEWQLRTLHEPQIGIENLL